MSEDLSQQIAHRAYEYFLARGGEHGHHVEDWLAAEADLTTPYDVVLVEAGGRTIELVRVIRELTGLGLPEIRGLIGAAPRTIKRVASRSEADAFRAAIEPLGARLELRAAR